MNKIHFISFNFFRIINFYLFIFCKKIFSIRKNFKVVDFNEEYYLKMYPDVAASKINPIRHFQQYGKKEKRTAKPPSLKISPPFKEFSPQLETIIVINHDASRAGCPVLSLNICGELIKNFNVISFFLDDGPLLPLFKKKSNLIVGPYQDIKDNSTALWFIIKQLNSNYKIKFAIVNSLASAPILKPLAENFIPCLFLMHEFFLQMRPEHQFAETFLWAGSTIFPAKMVQAHATNAITKFAIAKSHILHQGKCDSIDLAQEKKLNLSEEKLYNQMLQRSKNEKIFIVLGAGIVDFRKGVDLFIATAQEIKRAASKIPIIMLWAGRGFDPQNDLSYSIYLDQQLAQLDLANSFYFIGETSNLDQWYNLMNLFFISSRLDPFPNVAIDALIKGIPVICFDKTTGICEFLKKNSQLSSCIIPPISTYHAGQKIIEFSKNEKYYQTISEITKKIAEEQFCIEDYVKKLISYSHEICLQQQQEKLDCITLSASEYFRPEYYLAPNTCFLKQEAALRYIRSWHKKIQHRKPSPGFNPEIYAQLNDFNFDLFEPFAHFLKSGSPQGPWQETIIVAKQSFNYKKNNLLKIALHIHVYYVDLLPQILGLIAINHANLDLLISTDEIIKAEKIHQLLSLQNQYKYTIKITPNRGRDIAPFFTGFSEIIPSFDVVGHIHTKKSLDIADRSIIENWVNFLYENLIGGKHKMIDQILTAFISDPSLGMVFPSDPNLIGWTKNLSFAETFAKKLKITSLPNGNFSFPVGTMFWARPQALKPLFDLGLTFDDYPNEPLPYDGSLLHAIERLLPIVVKYENYRNAETYVPGVTR